MRGVDGVRDSQSNLYVPRSLDRNQCHKLGGCSSVPLSKNISKIYSNISKIYQDIPRYTKDQAATGPPRPARLGPDAGPGLAPGGHFEYLSIYLYTLDIFGDICCIFQHGIFRIRNADI